MTLDSATAEANLAAGTPYVVRMKVPSEGVCQVHDLLRGTIDIEWRTVDMQVLMKSDGLPTYHLANVVDDHLMEITHVFRGEEWLSSAPKHILLYHYFGWEMPVLCHTPLLRNADRSKLSKRKNPTGILYYKRMGYLPEALVNFLGLLAIPIGEDDEMMDFARVGASFRRRAHPRRRPGVRRRQTRLVERALPARDDGRGRLPRTGPRLGLRSVLRRGGRALWRSRASSG